MLRRIEHPFLIGCIDSKAFMLLRCDETVMMTEETHTPLHNSTTTIELGLIIPHGSSCAGNE